MDPPPSVPSANGTNPSATAAALPPEDPPGFRAVSNGLRLAPKSGLSQVPRKPMTGEFVLPTITAPAFSTRSAKTQRASTLKSFSARTPPNVAGQPGLKSNRSLMAVGNPCSGPSSAPERTASSADALRYAPRRNPCTRTH